MARTPAHRRRRGPYRRAILAPRIPPPPREDAVTRPQPDGAPEPGHQWVAQPAGDDWRPLEGLRCRANAGPGRNTCAAPSVAALNRRRVHNGRTADSWWAYCGDHLYGGWIEAGQVMRWVQEVFPQQAGSGPAAPGAIAAGPTHPQEAA